MKTGHSCAAVNDTIPHLGHANVRGASQSRKLGEGAGEAASAVRKRPTPNPKRQMYAGPSGPADDLEFGELEFWDFRAYGAQA